MTDATRFAAAAQSYLQKALDAPRLEVRAARRIVGGVSRHTWSVDVSWGGQGTETDGRPDGLIFRMDPPASLLESNRSTEYALYRAMAQVPGVPVPRVLVIEDDPTTLGMPFFVMERLPGVAWPGELLDERFDATREELVRSMYGVLGTLTGIEPGTLPVGDELRRPGSDEPWMVELGYWERTLRRHDMGPRPVTEAVLRHLRRHPPPPPSAVRVVHGDFRIGNVLFEPERITGVLDWEMAHLGDPHEDLAWSFARNWRSARDPGMVGGCLSEPDAIAQWQAASGLEVDQEALAWWRLFSHVKAIAIWLTGGHEFATGRTTELVYATLTWMSSGVQERWMLEDLGVATS